MSEPPSWVAHKLIPILQATLKRNVLVVEGDNDLAVYERWAARIKTPRQTLPSAEILVAGSKSTLLKGLAWLRDEGGNPTNVFGLVDRDEWDSAIVAARRHELPQLRVNSTRHCLESYFSDPEEVIASLAAADGEKLMELRKHLRSARMIWVPHWALWVTLQRACVALSLDAKFPNVFFNQHPLPKDGIIKQQLREWSDVLKPKTLFEAFEQERASSLRKQHSTQFRSCVYAKDFFPQVVLPELRKLDHTVKSEDWMVTLAQKMPDVPADVKAILQPIV